jgi:hypothetical protein
MVELGQVDLITEVWRLASHLACPREGHLEAVYSIFAYLDNKHNSRMVFDPTYPEIDMSAFKKCDWKEFYTEAKEPLPPTCRNLVVRRLIVVCMWTLTTPVIN